jgi:hypothetical protein
VAREMTVKSGQKCTAIRRVLVPADVYGAVAEAVSARLAKTTVGNPRNETVRMGALVSRAQKAAVQGEQRASKAREAEILELHATNVRIAQLAFAQASLAEEVAASPLSITNRPSYASPPRGRTPPASVPADSPLVIELLNEPRLAVSGSLVDL